MVPLEPALTGAGGILSPEDIAAREAYAERFRRDHEPLFGRNGAS